MPLARASPSRRREKADPKRSVRPGTRHPPDPQSGHRFKVLLCDFACADLRWPGQPADFEWEPYLRIDFDNFKIYKTDPDVRDGPAWAFQAGFMYTLKYLERLREKKLRIFCCDQATDEVVGEASLDLHTIACGPENISMTLIQTSTGSACGALTFVCSMRMTSFIMVFLQDLSLSMQGFPAPARLVISTTLAEEDGTDLVAEICLPHSPEGSWPELTSFSMDLSLNELLRAPTFEMMKFFVLDDSGVRQGEAQLAFRNFFSMKPQETVLFKLPVTYSEDQVVFGAVGELEGSLRYEGLPVCAQMIGGQLIDGEVQGAASLYEGLPFPQSLSQAPPVWEPELAGLEALMTQLDQAANENALEANPEENEMTGEHSIALCDIDDRTIEEALEQVELPPYWERRGGGDRSGDNKRMYFIDQRSRLAAWKDPRFLPANWDQRIDANSGKVYFLYLKNGEQTYVDPRGTPRDWDMRLSKSGRIYFAFLPAMKTTFTDPRGLPEGVDMALDDLGRTYFKMHASRTTTWKDPRDDQQEVTLGKWRQKQYQLWLKEQVFREIEELQKARAEAPEAEEDAT